MSDSETASEHTPHRPEGTELPAANCWTAAGPRALSDELNATTVPESADALRDRTRDGLVGRPRPQLSPPTTCQGHTSYRCGASQAPQPRRDAPKCGRRSTGNSGFVPTARWSGRFGDGILRENPDPRDFCDEASSSPASRCAITSEREMDRRPARRRAVGGRPGRWARRELFRLLPAFISDCGPAFGGHARAGGAVTAPEESEKQRHKRRRKAAEDGWPSWNASCANFEVADASEPKSSRRLTDVARQQTAQIDRLTSSRRNTHRRARRPRVRGRPRAVAAAGDRSATRHVPSRPTRVCAPSSTSGGRRRSASNLSAGI